MTTGDSLLSPIAGKIPAGGLRRHKGVIVDLDGDLAVNVNGKVIPVTYLDPLSLKEGDGVLVDFVASARGQSEAVVMGKLINTPRPSHGVVTEVPPSSTEITVEGADGTEYTASFVQSYTPTVDDTVSLIWSTGTPTVTGKYGTTAAPYVPPPPPPEEPPAAPVPPPPPPPETGKTNYAATNSGTWTPGLGSWDNWRGGGGHVHQGGIAYGFANHGAWFYSNGPKQLAGRTITKILFTLGSRFAIGAYNSPVVVHFYAHTSPTKPAGDVSRTLGPFNVTIPAGAGQRTFALPTSWAATLLAGGGIGISGEDYAGFHGRFDQPSSGLLQLYWTR